MKKVLALVVATGLLAAASLASAAGIAGTRHDLSPTGTYSGRAAGTTTQICVYCHAPHGSTTYLPLWNRNNPANAAAFKLYSGSNMASTSYASGFTADSTSLFCMSCHDGVFTMANVHNVGNLVRSGSAAGPAGAPLNTGKVSAAQYNLGTDLRTTHPVNFPVTTNDSQSDLWIPATAPTSMGGGVPGVNGSTFPLFKLSGNRATSRSLECGSCHAVHDSTQSPFLRWTMNGSQLCLGCHNK